MMSRTLGAPLGGTTRGGQYGLESVAVSLITPPNGSGCGGSCFPSIVTVALGEPGTPLICWAVAMGAKAPPRRSPNDSILATLVIPFSCSAPNVATGQHGPNRSYRGAGSVAFL